MDLDAETVRNYRKDGFVLLPGFASPEEVTALRKTFVDLFARRAGRKEGCEFDMLGHDEDDEAPVQPQILDPAYYASELRRTPFLANAKSAAASLLGAPPSSTFGHAILKPPGAGVPTPWHQDEAYHRDPNSEFEQVSIWLALQDVTTQSGCLYYLPGSNRGPVLQHHRVGDDPKVHSLECMPGEFDERDAVACPVPAGTAIAHSGRTLHAAGANTSNESRYAYVLAFQLPATRRAEPVAFPWNHDVQTARIERQRRWRHGSGLVVDINRRIGNRVRRVTS